MSGPSIPSRRIRALAALAAAAVLAFVPGRGAPASEPLPGADQAMHAHGMNSATMLRETQAWYAAHPAHGGSILATVADTFLVANFIFDTDGNPATQIDTAKIHVDEAVMFKWNSGFHTTTSGNPGDPQAGSQWDHPIDNTVPANLEFTVTFSNVGTFPFFCRPHGSAFNMKGVVAVQPTSVGVPGGPVADGAGFTRDPAPNPTRTGATFQFAMPRPGRVRVEVFDASGRRVALALDRELGAGPHEGGWNGQSARGAPVGAGVYYLRLAIPGSAQTRRIVIER